MGDKDFLCRFRNKKEREIDTLKFIDNIQLCKYYCTRNLSMQALLMF